MTDDRTKALTAPLELHISPTRDDGKQRWQVYVAYQGKLGIGDADLYLGPIKSFALARTEAGARRRGERMIRKIEAARRWMSQEPATSPEAAKDGGE